MSKEETVGSGRMKNLRKFAAADERVVNCERALRDAEVRHDRELADEQLTRCLYLKIWMERHGAPLRISQDELRAAGAELKRGARLTFEVESDGETLRIGVVSAPVLPCGDGAGQEVEKSRQFYEGRGL